MRLSSSIKITFVFLAILAVAAFLGARTAGGRRDGNGPVIVDQVPANASPNQQVQITVQLSQPTQTGMLVVLGSTDPFAYVDLPPSVYVPAGQSSYSFYATTSSSYSSWDVLTATANGISALFIALP